MPIYEIAPLYPVKALDKLKRQLAEAEAAVEARKKPPEDAGPRIIGEGLVIDEWVRHFSIPFSPCPFGLSENALLLHHLTLLCSIFPFYTERKKGKIPGQAAG